MARLAREIHAKDPIPIIFLTAKTLKSDILEGFNEKYGCNIPLILMDSFNTLEATRDKVLGRGVRQFEQSKCPRIYSDTLEPVEEENERLIFLGNNSSFSLL